MSNHARLSPSNHRWVYCPGSLREEGRYPDVSGDAAIDGTGSHLLLELCIKNSQQAADFIGQTIGEGDEDKPKGWTVDAERAERVQMCLDYIQRRRFELMEKFSDGSLVVEAESKADVGGYFGRTDWYGTCDITISVLNPSGGLYFIEVVDYKDGRGFVSEKDNSQLLAYCGGKMRPYVGSGPELVRPFRTNRIGGCRMTIVQPKTNPVVRYQDASPDEIMDKLIELDAAASRTDDPDAPLIQGKHCEWCKANPKRGGHCTVALQQSLNEVTKVTNELQITNGGGLDILTQALSDVSKLNNDQLASLADAEDDIKNAFDRIRDEIQQRLENGQTVNGYEMGAGRSSYIWNVDEESVVKALKGRRLKLDEIYVSKLISPAQMKKLPASRLTPEQKRRIEKEFVTEKIGKWTLKKVARKEQVEVVEVFKDVPKEEEPKEISFL